jgi:hypothetical protein
MNLTWTDALKFWLAQSLVNIGLLVALGIILGIGYWATHHKWSWMKDDGSDGR